jgi:uncharacterized protein YndB with AHSA1/START domain
MPVLRRRLCLSVSAPPCERLTWTNASRGSVNGTPSSPCPPFRTRRRARADTRRRRGGRACDPVQVARAEDVEVETRIAAHREMIWDALTVEERRREWWSYLDLDARRGGRVHERWMGADSTPQTTTGEVVEIEPPSRLICTWQDDGWPVATRVELAVEPDGDATRVRVRHVGWESLPDGEALRVAHTNGWRMHLENLKRSVERTGRTSR